MPRRPPTLQQQDMTKGVKAVTATGVGIPRVEIDKQGRMTGEKRPPDRRGHDLLDFDAPSPQREATSTPERAGRILSRPMPRRGLSRIEAAMYLGISPSKFDEMRKDGRIGPAKLIDRRKVFDVRMLDEIFDALPEENYEEAGDWTAAV
jgi:hypothetical protein